MENSSPHNESPSDVKTEELKRVSLSITDFALPSPRRGSIDALSGLGRATQVGQEIHKRIQNQRETEFSHYRSEVPVTHDFQRGRFIFTVSGRIDGFFEGEPAQIEEIKSTFSLYELSRRLKDLPNEHPYCLQLKTYGYIHWLKTQTPPKLSFLLVSTRKFETEEMDLPLDLENYENWLNLRLDELVVEAELAEKRALKRKRISKNLPFPFNTPRSGQLELIETIRQGILNRQKMLIQAPTGLGKTAGVLYPTLVEALGRGQRVIYVTPKNSQHAVAEDAVTRLQETGTKIRSLTITAKSKICFKNEPLCSPEYCEYAKNHYTKVAEHQVLEKLSKKRKLNARTFEKIGKEFEVCPFEIQLDAARDVETVICDYNYVFAPRSAFGRLTATELDQEGRPNLVIDEAHNLPSRAMDYYSPALSSVILEKIRDDLQFLSTRFKNEASVLIDQCIQVILDCKPKEMDRPSKIDPPSGVFLEQDSELRSFLSRYLEADFEIQPKDPILRLCFYWSEFTSALEYIRGENSEQFFTTYHPHPTGGTVKITCCDASALLKDTYKDYENVVGFSATLKPFEFYTRLSGLSVDTENSPIQTSEFQSPFPPSRRKVLIIPQVSSKFSDRSRNAPKIAETIQRISALKRGNYFVFFPSFDFLNMVLSQFTAPEGYLVLQQQRSMKSTEIESVLHHLRSESIPTIVFAVQGGVFSEGVDYPGNMIIGAFIVGPPLPSFDLEREEMRKYYDKTYGSGFDYAYAYPAMAKAVQSAGRVIRSETDKGLIVLMDSRFTHSSYTQSMPSDWFEENPQELVSKSILKEVTDFWQSVDSTNESLIER